MGIQESCQYIDTLDVIFYQNQINDDDAKNALEKIRKINKELRKENFKLKTYNEKLKNDIAIISKATD